MKKRTKSLFFSLWENDKIAAMNPQAFLQKTAQLQEQVLSLETKASTLQTEKESLETQLLQANSQLEWLKKQLFGKRSEKF